MKHDLLVTLLTFDRKFKRRQITNGFYKIMDNYNRIDIDKNKLNTVSSKTRFAPSEIFGLPVDPKNDSSLKRPSNSPGGV